MARNYREEDHGVVFHLMMIVLYCALIVGWVMNIVTIWNTMNNPVTAKFILRCIGVFVGPIGGILGYLS